LQLFDTSASIIIIIIIIISLSLSLSLFLIIFEKLFHVFKDLWDYIEPLEYPRKIFLL
jgi:hypothetical protein